MTEGMLIAFILIPILTFILGMITHYMTVRNPLNYKELVNLAWKVRDDGNSEVSSQFGITTESLKTLGRDFDKNPYTMCYRDCYGDKHVITFAQIENNLSTSDLVFYDLNLSNYNAKGEYKK